MKKILVVVDMQNDFITGCLGTPEAQAIVKNVVEKIKSYQKRGDIVIFTQDTHSKYYLNTQEGKNLPIPHCIEGTDGWNIANGIINEINVSGCDFIKKDTFGSHELGHLLVDHIMQQDIKEIEFIGVCTCICVITNVLIAKTMLPEVKITVDASCCAGVTPESHRNALNAMKMCQANIINEQENNYD